MNSKETEHFHAMVRSMRLVQQNYWELLNQAKEKKGAEATSLFNLAKRQLKEVKKAEKKVDALIEKTIPKPHPWRIGAMDEEIFTSNHY